MRAVRPIIAAVASAVLCAGALVFAPSGATADPVHYYLALGDSLSVGYQPLPTPGDTNQGYTDDVYAALKVKDPSLVLVKLGCSGETTGTMINGGKCTDGRYPTGSQLTQAEAFLAAHKADTKYITIDIGANDVDGCATGGTIDPVCVAQGAVTITTNLNTIMSRLRAASGGVPKSAGMTYYDPFLAQWLTGLEGQVVATASVALLIGINTIETGLYNMYGFKVANVQDAFKTTNFLNQETVAPYGTLPVNVAAICKWTYMCSVGNIHANPQGYQVIANAFLAKLS
jgi:lysophospholipase L1-like esterase